MGYVQPVEAMPKVKAAAVRALEIDSTLARAHAALAGAAFIEWDLNASEREFQRTLELDPNDPAARAFYSHVLIALNRPGEAVAQAERAMQLDPLNAFHRALYGTVLYFVRRYDAAIVELQSALKTSPDLPIAHCGLWYAFNTTGRPEQALVAAEGCIGHYGHEVKDALSRGYSAAGYVGAMRSVADRLAAGLTGAYVAPVDVLIPYLHAGQKDLALEWLSRAVEARDPNLYGIVSDPFVADSLGGDPRFREIRRRTTLPG
jgi:tetratricopeptide (TPR) repeat protein